MPYIIDIQSSYIVRKYEENKLHMSANMLTILSNCLTFNQIHKIILVRKAKIKF